MLAVSILGSPIQSLELPEDNILMHRVTFSDPAGTSLSGGRAFDRKNPQVEPEVQPELGVNKLGTNALATNDAIVTIQPAKAVPRVTFFSSNELIATVSPTQLTGTSGTLRVSGREQGLADVRAPTYPPANLGVAVFTPLSRTVAIHIISDTAVPPHKPSITEAGVADLLGAINQIWSSQANITFVDAVIDTKVIAGDFGDAVDLTTGGTSDDENRILAGARNDARQYNVYLVHDLALDLVPINGATKRVPNPESAQTMISMKDVAGNLDHPQTLAHEMGHALGLPSDGIFGDFPEDYRQYQLMWKRGGGGRTITPEQARRIHRF